MELRTCLEFHHAQVETEIEMAVLEDQREKSSLRINTRLILPQPKEEANGPNEEGGQALSRSSHHAWVYS